MPGIFSNRCPICAQGAIFTGLYSMNEACPNCRTLYAREEGFFLGAMIFSYVLGIFSMVPTLVLLIFAWEAPIWAVFLVPSVQTVMLNPVLFRYSRIVWIHLAHRVEKKVDQK